MNSALPQNTPLFASFFLPSHIAWSYRGFSRPRKNYVQHSTVQYTARTILHKYSFVRCCVVLYLPPTPSLPLVKQHFLLPYSSSHQKALIEANDTPNLGLQQITLDLFCRYWTPVLKKWHFLCTVPLILSCICVLRWTLLLGISLLRPRACVRQSTKFLMLL